MSACALIEMLKRIGYPEVEKLDPQSLDWAFEDPSTLSFMQWVCSIGKENVLRKDEIKEYESLRKTGKVFSGSQLSDALRVSSHCGDTEDNNSLQSDVEQLEQVLQQVQDRKALLLKECSQLDVKQIALKSKLSKVEDLTSKAKRTCDEMLDTCNLHSTKLDDALMKLSESVEKLTDLYKPPDKQKTKIGAGKSVTDNVFLSQEDLTRYHHVEEKFSQDLTTFTKKRFFEGMSEIAGEKESTQYSILDVSVPNNISVDASEDDGFMQDCQEFALLQQIFPQSEVNRLNALVNAKKAVNAVQEAKKILHMLKTEQFPSSFASISHFQSRTEENIRRTQDEASQYEASIPDLVLQLGNLQGTEILTGDYDLKLRRQDYFTRNQDRVIEYLESQKSRSELLMMLFELELRFHERTHHLLCAVEKTLQKHVHDWNQRMKCYDDSDLSSVKFERNVVDARDTSCNRIYQMMAEYPPKSSTDNKHLYLPLEKVKARATSLHSTYESSQSSHLDSDESLKRNMSELEDCVRQSEAALYAGCSTSAGIPNLSPAEIQASMLSLQAHITSLRSNVDRAVTDIKNKKKQLKGNPVLCKERELFTLFHTKPDRLISVINGLEEKLKIQEMS